MASTELSKCVKSWSPQPTLLLMGNIYSVLTEVCSRVGANINYMTNTSLGSDLHAALHQTTQGPIKAEQSLLLLPAAYWMNPGMIFDCCDLQEGLNLFPALAHPHRWLAQTWQPILVGLFKQFGEPLVKYRVCKGTGCLKLGSASLNQHNIYSFIICREQLVPHPAAYSSAWLSNLQSDLWNMPCFTQWNL